MIRLLLYGDKVLSRKPRASGDDPPGDVNLIIGTL